MFCFAIVAKWWYSGCMKVKKAKRKKASSFHSIPQAMKKAGVVGGVLIRKGEWQRAKEAQVAGEPKPKGLSRVQGSNDTVGISDEVALQMAVEKAGGKTTAQLSHEYGISENHVTNLINKKFVNSRTGREVLKGILLHNAIAFGGQAAQKIEELNGMQSVVASGIMTQRFIDLDKHASTVQENIDLDEISSVGRVLKELDGCISVESLDSDDVLQ